MASFFICVFTCASVLGIALMAEDCSAQPDGNKETNRAKNQASEQAYLPLIGGVRAKVDPKDNLERILVLSPRGPIVIELQLNRDGQPFRVSREKLVDDMLKAADTNQDGKATWKELADSPPFTVVRFAQFRFQDPKQKLAYVLKRYDLNGNKLLDRREARHLLTQATGGPTFQIAPAYSPLRQPNITTLLDPPRTATI